MAGLRPLLLAPLVLLGAAAPSTETSWYSISIEGGPVIGYASSEFVEGADGYVITEFQAVSYREPGQPVTHMTDRLVTKYVGYSPREIFERIDNGGEWTELRAVLGPNEAIITRTTSAGKQTAYVKLPPQVFAYGHFGPHRCVFTGERFELNPAAMAVEHIVYRRVRARNVYASEMIEQRYDGSDLRSAARLSYNGDCLLVTMTVPRFGKTVTIEPTDRETALGRIPFIR
jgi:hypothetical protein